MDGQCRAPHPPFAIAATDLSSERTNTAPASASATGESLMPAKDHRLPTTVVPEKYTLTLEPDLKAFTFEGREAGTVRIRSPIKRNSLNAVELKVQEAAVKPAQGGAHPRGCGSGVQRLDGRDR